MSYFGGEGTLGLQHCPVGKEPQYLPHFPEVPMLLPGKWIWCCQSVLFQAEGRIPLGGHGSRTVMSSSWSYCRGSSREPWLRGGIWLAQVRAGLGRGRRDWWGRKTWRWHTWDLKLRLVLMSCQRITVVFSYCLCVLRLFLLESFTWEPTAACAYDLRFFFPPLFYLQISLLSLILLLLNQVLRREKPRELELDFTRHLFQQGIVQCVDECGVCVRNMAWVMEKRLWDCRKWCRLDWGGWAPYLFGIGHPETFMPKVCKVLFPVTCPEAAQRVDVGDRGGSGGGRPEPGGQAGAAAVHGQPPRAL